MNSVTFIKVLRYLIANDATMRNLFGASSVADCVNKRLFYKDATFADKEPQFVYPAITLKLDEDESSLRGSDTNTIFLEITIANDFKTDQYPHTANIRLKDRLKELLEDNHEAINAQAISLSEVLHCRDIAWVSAITYDDKTQGTQRLSRIICTIKAIVGD